MPDTTTPTTPAAVAAALQEHAAAAANRRLAAVACHRLAAIILEAHPEAQDVRLARGRAALHLGDVRFSENRRLRFWRVNLLANDEVAALEAMLREHASRTACPVWSPIIDEAGWVDLAQLATVAP